MFAFGHFQGPDTKTDRHPVDLLVWSPVCYGAYYAPCVNLCQLLSRHFYHIFAKIKHIAARRPVPPPA